MKKIILISCLNMMVVTCFSQQKQPAPSLSLLIGYPNSMSSLNQERNAMIEVGYQKKLFKFIDIEYHLIRSGFNSFIQDPLLIEVQNGLNPNTSIDNRGSISTYGLGVKFHLMILNSLKNRLSLAYGTNFYHSRSKSIDVVDQFLLIESTFKRGVMSNYSINYDRLISKELSIGIRFNLYDEMFNNSLNFMPTASFWGYGLYISKKLPF